MRTVIAVLLCCMATWLSACNSGDIEGNPGDGGSGATDGRGDGGSGAADGGDAGDAGDDAAAATDGPGGDSQVVPEVADYYVSPAGDDTNPGDIDHPFKSFEKAHSVVVAGDLVYFRGGTYHPRDPTLNTTMLTGTSGTADHPIRFWAYPGETVVFDFSTITNSSDTLWGIWFSGDYWHWKGIDIVGTPQFAGQNMSTGFRVESSSYCIFEQMGFHDNFGTGFVLHGTSTGNLILNCDAYNNQDPIDAYENSNGFMSVTDEGTENTFRGCRAWWNCDDGFDHFNGNGVVIHEECWAFWNGYVPGTFEVAGNGMGFKLGESQYSQGIVTRVARNCLAFENLAWGFDQNDLDDKIQLDNCTAYRNDVGVRLGHKGQLHIVQNCISYASTTLDAFVNAGSVDDHNSWNGGVTVTDADFVSVDSTGVDGPRGADGSLPVLDFLRLAPGSDLIDKGVDVGLPYLGAAPDLGAYERE